MNANEYQIACNRTSPTFEQDLCIEKRAGRNAILIHALLGMCSETGEFADALKKHIIYNQPLDVLNLREELGDKLWYITLACSALGIQLGEVMSDNITKLKLRYPEKFTEELAKERLDKKAPESCGCNGSSLCDKHLSELIE